LEFGSGERDLWIFVRTRIPDAAIVRIESKTQILRNADFRVSPIYLT